jgi:adenylate cyclase
MATDFEAEGLLEGVEGEDARKARIDLLRKLEEEGVPLEELRAAVDENRLPLLPVERVLTGEGKRYTREEVVEEVGLDLDLLIRLWRALGQPEIPSGEAIFTEEDVEAARSVTRFLDAGIPEERLLELTRAMSQATTGIATAVGEAFAEAILEPGIGESELALRYAAGARELVPVLDETAKHMIHLHLRERARNAVIGQAELASGQLPGAQPMAICFADLVGFTKLGERLPSEELGSVAGRLGELAADAVEPPVRLVKTIGDAAMMVCDEPDPLLQAALELVESAETEGEGFPSLHAGLAHGEALPRGGDWYGAPVNLASRITDFARPGSVVAAAEVHEAANGEYDWSRIGRKRLKGVKESVELFRVRPAGRDGDG